MNAWAANRAISVEILRVDGVAGWTRRPLGTASGVRRDGGVELRRLAQDRLPAAYITELSAPLTEDGPFYTDVQPGDLVYYNPRDSITIIYEETSSVPTLTYMGEITSDLSVFRDLPDDLEFQIALAD